MGPASDCVTGTREEVKLHLDAVVHSFSSGLLHCPSPQLHAAGPASKIERISQDCRQ